jgi:hypothetical protein
MSLPPGVKGGRQVFRIGQADLPMRVGTGISASAIGLNQVKVRNSDVDRLQIINESLGIRRADSGLDISNELLNRELKRLNLTHQTARFAQRIGTLPEQELLAVFADARERERSCLMREHFDARRKSRAGAWVIPPGPGAAGR